MIYCAGGMYYPTIKRKLKGNLETYCDVTKPMEFKFIVGSNVDKTYLTHNSKGLSLTSHHSSLYQITSDLKSALLVDYRHGGNGISPESYELTEEQKKYIQNSIDSEYWFD